MNDQDPRRTEAIKRLNDKRDFKNHVVVYGVVNTILVVVWAATGAGFFWPIWSIAGWGVGLAFHSWNAYGQRPITEDDIRAEMRIDDR